MSGTTSAELRNQVAVVTGAGSGIGRSIAHALAKHGAIVFLVGRRKQLLDGVCSELSASGYEVHPYACDLTNDAEIIELRDHVVATRGRVDLLVHSAGTITLGAIAHTPVSSLDEQFRVNVRAPFLLTQTLLPLIEIGPGQIAFINSSVGVRTKENVGAYAASKHALRAIADTLRMEVNPLGIRVVSVYPGNTATPMQSAIQLQTDQRLDPSCLLQPEDIAGALIGALTMPRTAEVTDIHIRPMRKAP
jgi:NAD(P)-dependent dehydrogenase (short-subunit alcohol dehydrogenase family)